LWVISVGHIEKLVLSADHQCKVAIVDVIRGPAKAEAELIGLVIARLNMIIKAVVISEILHHKGFAGRVFERIIITDRFENALEDGNRFVVAIFHDTDARGKVFATGLELLVRLEIRARVNEIIHASI